MNYAYPITPITPFVPNWTTTTDMAKYVASQNATFQNPQAQEREPMRGLYRVYIVNPETGEVKTTPAFVAKDDSSARLKAAKQLSDDVDVDDFDFVVERVGNVRAKRQVQEVKIAK